MARPNPILAHVNTANANAGNVHAAIAKPVHSIDSARKFAPETYSNKPPENRQMIMENQTH